MQSDNTVVFYSSTTNSDNEPWTQAINADCRNSFINAVLGSLISLDQKGSLLPSSLETFEWNSKEHYYTFKLKPNLHFQNGCKVSSKDLEFSILRVFFAAHPNEGSMLLTNLKGTEKIKHGMPFQSGLVEGVRILDESTVAITPRTPSPTFLYTIARSSYALVPQEELESDYLTWKKWPIGVGPYKINEANKEHKYYTLGLVNSQEYPNAPKKIIYELERYFTPDISFKDATAVQDLMYTKQKLSAPFNRRVIGFNYSTELGRNPDFRKAVNLALKRSEISNVTLVETQPLVEPLPPGSIGRLNIEERQDIAEATKLFKKVLGSQPKGITYKAPYTDDGYFGETYRKVIKNQLAKCGFNVEFVKSELVWNTFAPHGYANSPLELIPTAVDFFDPLLSFNIFKKGSPAINKFPNDDKLEELINVARESSDRDILDENLKQLSKYYIENNTIVNLFTMQDIVYFNTNKIKNIGNQFSGYAFFYLQNLEIK